MLKETVFMRKVYMKIRENLVRLFDSTCMHTYNENDTLQLPTALKFITQFLYRNVMLSFLMLH